MVALNSDEILMASIKKGNLDSLKPLFEKYHVRLYNFFIRLTYKPELSHDLTQNVFLRIMKYNNTYNETFKFSTWMYQLARNVLSDHFKKEKIQQSEFTNIENLSNEIESNEQEVEKREKKKILYEALAKLPEDQREILVMNRFEGMKYKKISEIMNSTEDAVKMKASRAIRKLREIYFEIA